MRGWYISICLACLMIFGCESAPQKHRQQVYQEQVYQEVIGSWMGAHRDDMVAQFGPPMSWEDIQPRCCDINGSYYYKTCRKIFTADATGRIVDGSLSGC